MKSFLDLNPHTPSQSVLSHSTVAQAWGEQTQCERLDFAKVRASPRSPGNEQTKPCCCSASGVYEVALTQPCSRRWLRGFLFGRPTLAITRPCGEHTSAADVINMRVTRCCLLRWGAESLLNLQDSSPGAPQLPGSSFLSQLSSKLTTEERVFQKSANTWDYFFFFLKLLLKIICTTVLLPKSTHLRGGFFVCGMLFISNLLFCCSRLKSEKWVNFLPQFSFSYITEHYYMSTYFGHEIEIKLPLFMSLLPSIAKGKWDRN